MKMTKKAGLVGAGVLTALVVASPFAWATGHGHDGHDGHHGPDGKQCAFTGGEAGAASSIPGNALGNIVTQAPVGGNNAANIGNCSDFLNGNLNDNLSGNDVNVLSPEPAEEPADEPTVQAPEEAAPEAPAPAPAPVPEIPGVPEIF